MQRILEPELMNSAEQARAYAEADFTAAHQSFIHTFQEKFPQQDITHEVLDLGCGPGDITRRFAQAFPGATLHGVDGAGAMLREAQRLNLQHGLAERIILVESRLPGLDLPQQHYHTIISNSLLHHLHNPHDLWESIKQHAKPVAAVFIMDLMRPDNADDARRLVDCYASGEPKILREDFYHSLCAAFTPEEVQQQLTEHALSQLSIEVISDRHMIVFGSV